MQTELGPLLCGYGVKGIDPGSSVEDRPRGSVETLLRAFHGEQLDESMMTLTKLAAAYRCYSARSWSVDADALRFLYCSALLPPLPSDQQVAAAVAAVVPGDSAWEREIAHHIWQKTSQDIPRILAAFAGLSVRYPEWQAIWLDAARKAQKKWQQEHERYAAEFRVLDPITDKLRSDPRLDPGYGKPVDDRNFGSLPEEPGIDSQPPPDCVATLSAMRDRITAEVHARDVHGVQLVRFSHPVGYQLSEALALCYLRSGQLAHARAEMEVLMQEHQELQKALNAKRGSMGTDELSWHWKAQELCAHPISLADAARCGRVAALDRLRQQRGTLDALRPLIPRDGIAPLSFPTYFGLTPAEVLEHTPDNAAPSELDGHVEARMRIYKSVPRFSGERFIYRPSWVHIVGTLGKAGWREIGFDPELPAIVSAKKKRGHEIELSFRPNRQSEKYREQSCRETGRVHSVSFDVFGRAVFRYQQDCRSVGPVKTAVSIKQEAPILLPAEEAALIQVGMQVKLLGWQDPRAENPGRSDAAVIDAFVPGKEPRAAVLAGIKLER